MGKEMASSNKSPRGEHVESQAVVPDEFEPWGITTNRAVKMVGGKERKVVVYDGTPLLGLRDGEEFEIAPFLGDATMYSRFSDWEESTKDRGRTAVMYDGQPIGFTSIPSKEVKAIAKKGYSIRLKAVCLGDLDGYPGIKEVVAMTPDFISVESVVVRALLDDLGAPQECPVLHYNEYDEEDFSQIATRNSWVFDEARIEVIPPEGKSKAKPHLAIYSKKRLVSEVAAKNSYYQDLLDITDSGDRLLVTAKRCEKSMGDGSYYHIAVYHWS